MLARINRIMLGSIPGIKTGFTFSYKFEDWNKMLDATKGLLPAPATPPAPLVAGACQPQPGEATSTIPTPPKPVIPSEERNLFAFDFCRALSTHGRRIRRNIND